MTQYALFLTGLLIAVPLARWAFLPAASRATGPVDSSGRIASNDTINALHWHPGSKLEVILTPRTIIIRTAPDGPCRRGPTFVRPAQLLPGLGHDLKVGQAATIVERVTADQAGNAGESTTPPPTMSIRGSVSAKALGIYPQFAFPGGSTHT